MLKTCLREGFDEGTRINRLPNGYATSKQEMS